jgi:hypothetical protein
MRELSGRDYFLGALYLCTASCSQVRPFLDQFEDRLACLPYDRYAVRNEVETLIKEYSEIEGLIRTKDALHLVIQSDLKKVLAILNSADQCRRIDREAGFDSTLVFYRDAAVEMLANVGLKIDPPEVFVVKDLPPPYNNPEYSVVTTDKGDFDEHGIMPGIHFREERLRPFLSPFILLHEMIHSFLGIRSPEAFGRGLEEGLAEVVGSLFLSSRILGENLTRNLFVYNRLSSTYSQFWELYLDYARQATFLYDRFGLKGLAALLDEGRGKIKDIEILCFRGELDSIQLPEGDWDVSFSRLLHSVVLAFPRALFVSPMAKYLLPFASSGKTVRELIKEANVDYEEGLEALRELQDRIVGIVLRNDRVVISFSDSELLSRDSMVRYEIK